MDNKDFRILVITLLVFSTIFTGPTTWADAESGGSAASSAAQNSTAPTSGRVSISPVRSNSSPSVQTATSSAPSTTSAPSTATSPTTSPGTSVSTVTTPATRSGFRNTQPSPTPVTNSSSSSSSTSVNERKYVPERHPGVRMPTQSGTIDVIKPTETNSTQVRTRAPVNGSSSSSATRSYGIRPIYNNRPVSPAIRTRDIQRVNQIPITSGTAARPNAPSGRVRITDPRREQVRERGPRSVPGPIRSTVDNQRRQVPRPTRRDGQPGAAVPPGMADFTRTYGQTIDNLKNQYAPGVWDKLSQAQKDAAWNNYIQSIKSEDVNRPADISGMNDRLREINDSIDDRIKLNMTQAEYQNVLNEIAADRYNAVPKDVHDYDMAISVMNPLVQGALAGGNIEGALKAAEAGRDFATNAILGRNLTPEQIETAHQLIQNYDNLKASIGGKNTAEADSIIRASGQKPDAIAYKVEGPELNTYLVKGKEGVPTLVYMDSDGKVVTRTLDAQGVAAIQREIKDSEPTAPDVTGSGPGVPVFPGGNPPSPNDPKDTTTYGGVPSSGKPPQQHIINPNGGSSSSSGPVTSTYKESGANGSVVTVTVHSDDSVTTVTSPSSWTYSPPSSGGNNKNSTTTTDGGSSSDGETDSP